jgi:hypothetical protein
MTIGITGSPDAVQQNGVQTGDQAPDTTVLITEAEVALGTAAATAVRQQESRWVALLSRILAVPKKSRSKRRPYLPTMAYLEPARLAREMGRL